MLQNNPPVSKMERLEFIDKACGIAILLVVYAHIIFPETLGINWYLISKTLIYKFHMPLFMCLSGYLAFLSTSNKNIKSKTDYLNFQKKKLYKFLPVYLIAVSCSVLLDVFYKHLIITEINQNILISFFAPAHGTAAFIWYLYVLFGFYLVTPFLLNLKSSPQYLLLLVGFLFTNFIDTVSPLFSAELFCKYFFFFFGGGLIYLNKDQFMSYLGDNGRWITFLTIGLLVLDLFIDLIIPFQVLSIGMIMSVLYISTLKWPTLISKIFTLMGVSSFAIYILNSAIMDVYYIFFKSILKMQIDGIFIFSSLVIAIVVSIFIRIIFNKVIPAKVYSL